ncbi:hypothetical protein EDD18DRAFT_1105490 [Armillaria luteobubalina]|uniref:Uncharacterized protein n=1 Tax=Armillaria luteobubalina TaxID=153913 RepID=A0AA39Q7I5_9AGAR|nr:hypothetical protein EDD18DRAFT_1105490 [Armillaria luteobubalina]
MESEEWDRRRPVESEYMIQDCANPLYVYRLDQSRGTRVALDVVVDVPELTYILQRNDENAGGIQNSSVQSDVKKLKHESFVVVRLNALIGCSEDHQYQVGTSREAVSTQIAIEENRNKEDNDNHPGEIGDLSTPARLSLLHHDRLCVFESGRKFSLQGNRLKMISHRATVYDMKITYSMMSWNPGLFQTLLAERNAWYRVNLWRGSRNTAGVIKAADTESVSEANWFPAGQNAIDEE